MRKVKSTLKVLFILVLGLSVNLSMAQTDSDKKVEEKKKEKKIQLKKVKMVNGEKVKWDTTIYITEENKDEVETYMKEQGHEMRVQLRRNGEEIEAKILKLGDHAVRIKELKERMEGDDGLKKRIEVIVKNAHDLENDAEWHVKHAELMKVHENILVNIDTDSLEKHIEIVLEGKDSLFHLYKMGEEHEAKIHQIMVEHHADLEEIKEHAKAFAFVMKDGEMFHSDSLVNFEFDFDGDFDIEGLEDIIVDIDLDDEHEVVWVDEDGKHKEIIKRLKYGKHKDKSENVFFVGDHKRKRFAFGLDMENELEEADFAILKDAGIKVKDNQLDIDRLRLSMEENEFGLIFKLESEGKTTIKVIDEAGNEVFSDKVQYFPGTYHKNIGLNTESEGNYFIHIEQGNASFSTKVTIH